MKQKNLTDAQRRYLAQLIERRNVAQNAIDEFAAYLADEHKAAAADGWLLRSLTEGFVREAAEREESPGEA